MLIDDRIYPVITGPRRFPDDTGFASLDTPIDTLIKISTQRSPFINTVSQTLMFQIRGVSIASQCVAVPDVPNWGGCVNCGRPREKATSLRYEAITTEEYVGNFVAGRYWVFNALGLDDYRVGL